MFTDLIPAKYRNAVYELLAFAAIVVGVWQATDGNWKAAIPALVVALSHIMAADNTGTEG